VARRDAERALADQPSREARKPTVDELKRNVSYLLFSILGSTPKRRRASDGRPRHVLSEVWMLC
jgi:hypothetical protein